jgi:hypothetical protein
MISLLISKYWKHTVLLLITCFLFNYVFNLGVVHQKVKDDKVIVEMQKSIATQVSSIEKLSSIAVINSTKLTNTTNSNLELILASVKKKPLTIIKEGKCVPSDEFKQGYYDLIKEVNK